MKGTHWWKPSRLLEEMIYGDDSQHNGVSDVGP